MQYPVEEFTAAERARTRAARHEPRPAGVRAGQPARRPSRARCSRATRATRGRCGGCSSTSSPTRCPRSPAGFDGERGRARGGALRPHLRRLRRRLGRPARRGARRRRVVLERPHEDPPAPAPGRLPRAVHALHRLRRADGAGGGYRYYRDPELGPGVRRGDGRPVRRYSAALPRGASRGSTTTFPRADGESAAARARARQRQGARPPARAAAGGVALAHGHLRDRPGLRAADPAPDRPPAARGAPLRRDDPRRDQGRDAELRRPRRAPRARRRVGRLPRAAPRERGERWAARLGLDRAGADGDGRPSVALLHVDGDEEQLLAALLFEAGTRRRGRGARGGRARCPATSARSALARADRRAPQPPPPSRPRLRGAALPLRDRLRLRRVPRPPAPPHAHRAVAGADARPRRRRAGGGRRRRRGRRTTPARWSARAAEYQRLVDGRPGRGGAVRALPRLPHPLRARPQRPRGDAPRSSCAPAARATRPTAPSPTRCTPDQPRCTRPSARR